LLSHYALRQTWLDRFDSMMRSRAVLIMQLYTVSCAESEYFRVLSATALFSSSQNHKGTVSELQQHNSVTRRLGVVRVERRTEAPSLTCSYIRTCPARRCFSYSHDRSRVVSKHALSGVESVNNNHSPLAI